MICKLFILTSICIPAFTDRVISWVCRCAYFFDRSIKPVPISSIDLNVDVTNRDINRLTQDYSLGFGVMAFFEKSVEEITLNLRGFIRSVLFLGRMRLLPALLTKTRNVRDIVDAMFRLHGNCDTFRITEEPTNSVILQCRRINFLRDQPASLACKPRTRSITVLLLFVVKRIRERSMTLKTRTLKRPMTRKSDDTTCFSSCIEAVTITEVPSPSSFVTYERFTAVATNEVHRNLRSLVGALGKLGGALLT